MQDEHDCLTAIFQDLIDITKKDTRGFELEVLGRKVIGGPWIHFFIGDRKGNNRLAGAFQDNQGKCQRPHLMCKCRDFANTDVNCELVTVEEIDEAKERASLMSHTHRH